MSKTKIDGVFDKLKESGDKAFISYMMAGDGGLGKLKDQIKTLEESAWISSNSEFRFQTPSQTVLSSAGGNPCATKYLIAEYFG